MKYFETKFLEEAREFILKLDAKISAKILYNIDLAEKKQDPRLFKKLSDDIWEFRIRYARVQIRLLAFWDKTNNKKTLVIATHGFIKKVDKVAGSEIEKANKIRMKYFENKID
ncbi:type II toxin-antitoxin system RelE/ParE family toxin [Flavobacterium zhairuonense]|uniref:type II toxin-antitoxin system RelE/ParE family toxin n=1 Tax=Flavobacterium zhairuonense TaxID=2493631 RepID=UPI001046B693|nr:type II toxin-antitoxin system RelE/ParE family toxin [Flavobacterium zhairuonense]KAF2506658.1 type II toxin-antitoxin system RelE/ParE family toxin [Flavobacterium zhairuonense]